MSSERIVKIPGEYISNVFGKFDENIQALERKCNVTIVNREDSLIISGTAEDTDHAEDVLHKLIAVARSGENVQKKLAETQKEYENAVVVRNRESLFVPRP